MSQQNESYVPVTEMQVSSWSEGEAGAGVPPTQVHILYRVKELGAIFVMRLKSKEATDSLIAALIKHRNDVWGQ